MFWMLSFTVAVTTQTSVLMSIDYNLNTQLQYLKLHVGLQVLQAQNHPGCAHTGAFPPLLSDDLQQRHLHACARERVQFVKTHVVFVHLGTTATRSTNKAFVIHL